MTTFSKYYSWLLGIIDKSGIVSDRSTMTRRQTSKFSGRILAPDERGFAKPALSPTGLIFVDGAYLRFLEEIVIVNREVQHLTYSYHYQRPDGYYFRYDKLSQPFEDPVERILEPQRHLQVAQPAPRFPTHSTNLSRSQFGPAT
jgi:hypothetical protein